jgi:transmembrane 9 superfamily protein 2/4
LLFALVGFLSPANRGGLLTAMLSLWILNSVFAGYVSSRLYKSLGGLFWKRVALGTGLLFPGLIFSVFFCLNFLMWLSQSNDTVPFSTLVLILFLWFGISLPLIFLGTYFGRRRASYEFPVRVNQIPRKIPRQPWYNNTILSVLIGGILPFGSVFIQLVFILGSLWQNEVYYMFGFLSSVFILLIVTSAEISIVLCYLRLCGEDYRWWFYSFFSAGSSGLYVFLYSLFYLMTQPDFHGIDFVSLLVYLSYMSIISLAFTFLTGYIGFLACFWFTRKIYSAIRVD